MAYITEELREEISRNVMLVGLKKLQSKYKISIGYLAMLRIERERGLKVSSTAMLGHKNETYLTEEEMLLEHNYNFESLSSSEKQIWNGVIKSCRI
ncbi:hypothetical protein UFOVP207_19 [uncultured Caudovirales phage]|uniref:Uncharacterized protein n=1 Tax=uncultured Caudovirales phage TaxID=2100421 RepID=A0A6J7WQN4_9CAUD|nr:hypothetical protein UFOVP207_19 [uncultured Caudovirales phage]